MQNYGIKARYPYNEINVKEIYNQKNYPLSGGNIKQTVDITTRKGIIVIREL